jgi:hypothetical protein
MWLVPSKVTVSNPVSEVVGKVPTSPVIVVGPVLVIPEPAKTEKLAALPRSTVVGLTAEAEAPLTAIIHVAKSRRPKIKTVPMPFLFPTILLNVVIPKIRVCFLIANLLPISKVAFE